MLLCMPCSPSTANFITKTTAADGSPVVEVAVCRSFCDLIYKKCNITNYSWLFEEFKNGEELCTGLLFNSTNYIHEGAKFKLTQVRTGKCFNEAGRTAVARHMMKTVSLIALLCVIFAIII